MSLEVVELEQFIKNGPFLEDVFVNSIREHDWHKYNNSKVLVRGCQSTVVPPWAYMMITAQLTGFAKSVRFGNEHDNIVVFRRKVETPQ